MSTRKILDYIIVGTWGVDHYGNDKRKDLCRIVNEYIKVGYTPIGSPFIDSDSSNTNSPYNQAMVKYEEPVLKNMRKLIDLMDKKLTPEEIEEIEREALQEYEIMKDEN